MVCLFLSPLEPEPHPLSVLLTFLLRTFVITLSVHWLQCLPVCVYSVNGEMNSNNIELSLLFFFSRYGRRIPYASFMIFGGLAGTLVSAVPSDEGK